jgi:glycosyltransferase involved in cell wall biosynthesis
MPGHWTDVMGGAQYQVKCLLERLTATQQFDISYLARNYDPRYQPDGYRLIKIAAERGVRRYGFWFDAPRLLQLLRQWRPQILYQRIGCAYTGIAAHYARKSGCRMVWHVSSDNDLAPRPPLRNLQQGIRYVDWRLLQYGVRQAGHIVAQSRGQAERLEQCYGRLPTCLVRNFHPLPAEEVEKTEPVKIVWVSNFKPIKQPHYFIRLARDLGEAAERVECIMVGAPARRAVAWQRSIEREIAAVPHLKYLGARPLEEVNRILDRSHILVNTSLYEGFPNTFIQAWMRRLPVVSLNSDPDDVLKERHIGFLCNSYSALLKHTQMLIRDSSLREKMGYMAQEYALEHHSERNIDLIIQLFHELAGDR